MSALLRAARIGRVLLRYRLDDLLDGTPAERWLNLARPFVPRASAEVAALSRGARLRLALQELGPIFVKFGQILSTRRDLMPPDIATELALLQDRVKPFDGETARGIVEQALGRDIADAFEHFDTTPLASASIAQVHAARLHDGREVVVKVLRPEIEKQIAGDIALLTSVATLVERTHPNADKIRPREIVREVETTLAAELDLQREGANASVIRRFWTGKDGQDSPDLYVPEVIWSHTAERALTLERVHGIPSDDVAALDAAGIDRKALAAKGVRVFYTQVFRDNFFHADAHAGNIWVDRPGAQGQSALHRARFRHHGPALQRGSVLPRREFHGDLQSRLPAHRRAARAGRLDAGARSASTNSKPRRARCASRTSRGRCREISLAEVLVKLFRTAQKYELTLQPQLILLQKTLLNIEGVGRQLDPSSTSGRWPSRCWRRSWSSATARSGWPANSASACPN
jgi:ubiquinone biosynthesis protein